LQNPISVYAPDAERGAPVLLAGAHRLAAYQLLGREEIPCVYVEDLDEIGREIWTLDENLCRAELTPAQDAKHLARRKELFDLKGGTNCTTLGGNQKIGFAKDAAQKIGRSRHEINRAIARAEAIPGIDDIAGTSLDKGVELDALAKLPPDQQRRLVQRAKNGE